MASVCAALVDAYGLPRHGNPEHPVDDLAYVLISNRTPPDRAGRVYRALKAAYPKWEVLPGADLDAIAAVLQSAGLARKKGAQLQETVATILRDYGSLDAPALWTKPDDELLAYLTSFNGVSDKVARCVLLYTLGREVLPVDVHTHRVAFRLGWTARTRPEQSHEELEALVQPSLRYAFHVGTIALGRKRCTARNPDCPQCPILDYCPTGRVRVSEVSVLT